MDKNEFEQSQARASENLTHELAGFRDFYEKLDEEKRPRFRELVEKADTLGGEFRRLADENSSLALLVKVEISGLRSQPEFVEKRKQRLFEEASATEPWVLKDALKAWDMEEDFAPREGKVGLLWKRVAEDDQEPQGKEGGAS